MRCPVCKADNSQGPSCRRCKADLSVLWALEDQRRRTLEVARDCLQRGDWQAALDRIEDADWLHSDQETRRLQALAHLLGRDFAAAWRCYQDWLRARKSE